MTRKPDELDAGIKKLLDSMHGEEIDERINAKFSELRSELEAKSRPENDIVPVITSLRETKDRLTRLEAGFGKLVESMCKKPSQTDQEKIWSTIQTEIDRLSAVLKEDAAKSNDRIEDLQTQLSGIREMFKEMRATADIMKSVDIKGVVREIESIKQKVNWMEQSGNANDIESIKDRLGEIENRLNNMKFGSPMVLE
jgi:septation ring formation regulator EzrA